MCGWTLQGQWATVFFFDFLGQATRSFVSNKNLTTRHFIKMAGLIYHDWIPTELPKTQKSYLYFLLHCIKTGGYFPNSPCAYVKICVSSNFYFLKKRGTCTHLPVRQRTEVRSVTYHNPVRSVTYRFLAVHRVHPLLAILLGQSLQSVDHSWPGQTDQNIHFFYITLNKKLKLFCYCHCKNINGDRNN